MKLVHLERIGGISNFPAQSSKILMLLCIYLVCLVVGSLVENISVQYNGHAGSCLKIGFMGFFKASRILDSPDFRSKFTL